MRGNAGFASGAPRAVRLKSFVSASARCGIAAVSVSLGAAPVATARADITQSARAIDVVLHRAFADVSVMVSLDNAGDSPVDWVMDQSLAGVFATDFSMQLDGRPWAPGLFLGSEAATNLFWQMGASTGAGQSGLSKNGQLVAALFSWDSQSSARLDTTLPARSKATFSFKVVVPITERTGGAAQLWLGSFEQQSGATLHVRIGEKEAREGAANLVIDDVKAPNDATSVASDTSHRISFDLPTKSFLSGDVAVLDVKAAAREKDAPADAAAVGPNDRAALVSGYFDLATHLGETPDEAHVVVLVDTSRSIHGMNRDGLASAVKSYVAQFDAHQGEVAVVAFDRKSDVLANVRAPSGAADSPFMSPADARDTVSTLFARPAKNGSNVDVALAKAAELLEGVKGPRRVVLFSDLDTAARIDPERLEAVLPKGALLHIVDFVWAADARLDRDDDGPWSGLARASGGLLWRGSAEEDTPSQRVVYEELARPKRLDHVKITPTSAFPSDSAIPEGTRVSTNLVMAHVPATITVEGELWSTKTSGELRGTDGYRAFAAGQVFATSVLSDIDASAWKGLATLGHALSPVTSFVLRDGVRSPEGSGFPSDYGRLSGSHRSKPPRVRMDAASVTQTDPVAWLENALRPIADACANENLSTLNRTPDAHTYLMHFETTFDEIVDLEVEGAPSEAIRDCVAERAWDVMLDPVFERTGHTTWTVDLTDPSATQ